jgi:predicted PhzF superfamily epimerase YddE/YHI9
MSSAGVTLQFPRYATRVAEVPDALRQALGIDAFVNAAGNDETRILLIEIADRHELAALRPDFLALVRAHAGINGVLVTAQSGDDGFDFHSRYFWPWSGTDEDPVTGGTHTFLAPYWASRLGRKHLRSFQSSARSGSMSVEVADDGVIIRGQAVTVLRGAMTLSA